MSLTGKTILITGAALRIGRALALAVAKQGADLIVHYFSSSDEVTKLKSEIEDLGQSVTLVQVDFSDPERTQAFADQTFSDKNVYGLINNASIFEDLLVENTSLENWQTHFSINVTAPFLISKSFKQSYKSTEVGRIINMLDWRALRPSSDHFPYTISKAALVALTKSLAVSLAPGISVNGIALGAILPPIDGTDSEQITKNLPIPRWADTSEVEETALFLLTGPSYITGEIIHVDGGRHLI